MTNPAETPTFAECVVVIDRLTRERDDLRKAADDLAFALEAVNVQLEMWGKQSPIAVDKILSRYRSTLQSLKQGEG